MNFFFTPTDTINKCKIHKLHAYNYINLFTSLTYLHSVLNLLKTYHIQIITYVYTL